MTAQSAVLADTSGCHPRRMDEREHPHGPGARRRAGRLTMRREGLAATGAARPHRGREAAQAPAGRLHRHRSVAGAPDPVRVRRGLRRPRDRRARRLRLRLRADAARRPDYASARTAGAASPKAGLRGHHRRRPGDHGGRQPGRHEAGGMSVGRNIELPHGAGAEPVRRPGVDFHYFFVRKMMFVKYADAFVIFPAASGRSTSCSRR